MRNWRTTLAGIGLSFIPFGQEILKMLGNHQSVDFRNIALGAGFIALGALSKDYNVAGDGQAPVAPVLPLVTPVVEPQEPK